MNRIRECPTRWKLVVGCRNLMHLKFTIRQRDLQT